MSTRPSPSSLHFGFLPFYSLVMSATTNNSFPAPVGGVPSDRDFGPSVLFAILYAILIIIAIYRFARTATRTLVVLGTFAFAVER